MAYEASGIDDLIRQIQEDENADKVETTTHATPIEYARARGMAPQTVYYALRNHGDQLQTEDCKCGRRVLDISKADEYFKSKQKKPDDLTLRIPEEEDDDETAE
jgi:hypothetical protein